MDLLTKQQASDLLCCAFEGGSNYWYSIIANQKPERFEFLSDAEHAQVMEREPTMFPHLDYPLNPGGSLTIVAESDDGRDTINGEEKWTLDLAAIERGARTMFEKYPQHFADAISEQNADADTGDVFLQCCCFQEVVFG